jgi:hypothetical protein
MKHHPTKLEQELIVRVGVKSYRRLAAIEAAQAAEDDLFEKRLAAFHWMKQAGVKILNEVEREDD